tara:strand:- start:14466 stop:14696 length:231 start_codon:yes stop_codon:yes gene_type:complete
MTKTEKKKLEWACNNPMLAARSILTLEEKCRKYKSLLKMIEYTNAQHEDGVYECPYCCSQEGNGHHSDCVLKALLT